MTTSAQIARAVGNLAAGLGRITASSPHSSTLGGTRIQQSDSIDAGTQQSAHKTGDGSASDIDSGNRGLEGDDDGSPETLVTLVPGKVMDTGCCIWGSGLELNRFLSPGDLVELTLGPFGTQRNRVVT